MPAAVGAAVLGEIGLESIALTEAFFGAYATTIVGYSVISSPLVPLHLVMAQ